MYVYKITCKINNKIYIGITNNYNRRMNEHNSFHNKKSLIDIAIHKLGKENFIYEILFSGLTIEESKEKEIELIKFYNSKYPNGFNLSDGGDLKSGENNGRAKISDRDADNIRIRFNNDENYLKIYEDYKDKISLQQFLKIINNKTYLNSNIRAKEKSLYNQGYITKLEKGSLKFTKEEVQDLRKMWLDKINYKEAYERYKNSCSLEYFYQVYYGILYKDIMPEVFTKEMKKIHSSLSHSGENNSKAKLKKEQVILIREFYKNKEKTVKEMSEEYGVSTTTIRDIINYKTWKNI